MVEAAGMIVIEFSPYAMHRMHCDPTILIEILSQFKSVEIFERESEEALFAASGTELATYLQKYYDDYKLAPKGRYLNLIGVRA